MAMTKAEKERMERLEHAAAMAMALRFPTDPCPQPMTKDAIKALLSATPCGAGKQHVARGWFMNAYSIRVTYGCSDGVHHSHDGDRTTSQHHGRMYRTKSEAWRALRHEKIFEVAKFLAQIDAEVAAAQKEEAEKEPAL